jgi:hypothetical protein
MSKTIGYKGFKKDIKGLYCQPEQTKTYYKVGKIYIVKGELSLCKNGFHFCEHINSVHDYYHILNDVICEVEILGDVVTDGTKSCTNKIKILKELTKQQVLTLSNNGYDNTGVQNSGNWNSGNCNSGDRNSGNWNSGNRNSGHWNSGDYNSGDWNSGNRNSGSSNSGNSNSGSSNSGDWNSGNRNSGHWNSGKWNSGDSNSGSSNSGDWNSGNRNSGSSNSGNWNSGDYNSGFFNTNEPTIRLFNNDTNMTITEFRQSKYYAALMREPLLLTDYIDGKLINYDYKEACDIWWNKLTEENKKIIMSMPNFNAEIFAEITGIKNLLE